MPALETPEVADGWPAADFALPDADGNTVALADVRGPNGTVVMFICNHCPYVQAVAPRIARDAKALRDAGIGVVAIMPNDTVQYPDDAPDKMKAFAARHGFAFPYLIDETQAIARAYDAVCTPDFFGFDAELRLRYRGRLDASRRDPAPEDARRELVEAMTAIAETGAGPAEQHPSIGCSIKWRADG